MADEALHLKTAQEVLRDTGRDSYGVVRLLAKTKAAKGQPGDEVEYFPGAEALVEAGQAEWVVAPVHLPSAGRRLDVDAEREPTPLDGIEAYPPAEPTTPERRAEARREGFVKAHTDSGIGEKIAGARANAARDLADSDGDATVQAALGGHGARSGPVTASSELPADQPPEDAGSAGSAKSGTAKSKS